MRIYRKKYLKKAQIFKQCKEKPIFIYKRITYNPKYLNQRQKSSIYNDLNLSIYL